MRLEDGTGKGYSAEVTEENMLKCVTYSNLFIHHVNHHEKRSYSFIFDVAPDVGGCFFYIKNTDDHDMVITSLTLHSDSTENIDIRFNNTGTPVNGNTGTPVNRTAGTANTADAVYQTGNNITGLTAGDIVENLTVSPVGFTKVRWDSSLIVPKNTVITMWDNDGNCHIKGTIATYFSGLPT